MHQPQPCRCSHLKNGTHYFKKAKNMAETKRFEELVPIFGEVTAELQGVASAAPRRSFLFCVHSLDSSRLEIVASDFHSHTFERVLTFHELDDLRDETGIGGSRNDFVDYLVASLSTGDAKLIIDCLENRQADYSISHAKLIIHKSKGLPRISISLSRLLNLSAKDVTANLSSALFKAYKDRNNDIVKGQEQLSRLKEMLSSEMERNKSLQKQLDALSFSSKRKVPKTKFSDKTSHISGNLGNNELIVFEAEQTSANTTGIEKPPSKEAPSLKGKQRAVPTHRRAKVRGVSLQDNDDDDGR